MIPRIKYEQRCWPQAGIGDRVLNTGAKLRRFTRASQTPSVSGPDSLESVLFEKASDIYIINTEQGNMIETPFKNKKPKTLEENALPWRRSCDLVRELPTWPRGWAEWTSPHPWRCSCRGQVPPPQGRGKGTSDLHKREAWSPALSEFGTYDWKNIVAFLETEVYLTTA